jgi:hypothetical protein
VRPRISYIFVDLSSPYPHRLNILEYCWGISQGRVYGYVERGLATAFFHLYTKLKTAGFSTELELAVELKDSDEAKIQFRLLILVARLVLPLVSIGLFYLNCREKYPGDIIGNDIFDVKITYAIFCCTAVLEICSALPILLGQWDSMDNVFSSRESLGRWPGMVAQYSLIGYLASNKKHSSWMFIAGILVDQRILCTKPCSSSTRISRLVLGYLKDGWKEEIRDAPSYRAQVQRPQHTIGDRCHIIIIIIINYRQIEDNYQRETFTDKLQREQEPPSHEAGSNDTAEPTREVSTTTSMDRLQREHLPSQGGNQCGIASTSEICEVADDVV